MKKTLFGAILAAAVLGFSAVPSDADAFTLTGNSFKGFTAFDKSGDVINTFGLGSSLPACFTGKKFNFAAGLDFDVTYNPTNPTITDVQSNPNGLYLWKLSIKNAALPWGSPLNFELRGITSLANITSGAGWFKNKITPFLPEDLCFAFDHTFTSPTTGKGRLALAGNINANCLPWWVPDQYICPWESDACVTLSADNVCDNEPVPEPVTMLLFGAGLAGLGIVRKVKSA